MTDSFCNSVLELMDDQLNPSIVEQLAGDLKAFLFEGSTRYEAVSRVRQRYRNMGLWEEHHEQALERAIEELEDSVHGIELLKPLPLSRPEHVDWYSGPSENDPRQPRWPSLRERLLEKPDWDGRMVDDIDDQSTRILASVNQPMGEVSTHGLVIGFIQSGKTANMTAVIAKAADAGFRLIIVLAGMTDALRNQTQRRMINDLSLVKQRWWKPLTQADHDYERPADGVFRWDGAPMVAVVKKNTAPLRKLLRTIRDTQEGLLNDLPALVIDDECDQASVNTRNQQISAINRLIRELLDELPRPHYVGYTATPFANVLINPEVDPNSTADLYPRDFIVALPKPSGYFGAEELFGGDIIDANGTSGQAMINMIPADDVPLLRPQANNRQAFEPQIAESLENALCYFVLAVCARSIRGHAKKLSSMLIHTTHFVDTHERIAELVRGWRSNKISWILREDNETLNRMQTLWCEQIEQVDETAWGYEPIEFDDLKVLLPDILESIQVIVENSESEERLDPENQKNPYIVIGGNVLARGLTLEGLVTTYFLRTTSQYDTLLQTGRWFGYRKGYEDLPRIWMTRGLAQSFEELSRVEIEIRDDIDLYAARKMTPIEFAVRIRQIPGMAVTARNKMFHAERCNISFHGAHIQTRKFKEKDQQWLESNIKAGEELFVGAINEGCRLSEKPNGRPGRLFEGVPVHLIRKFLTDYQIHEDHSTMQSGALLEYIDEENQREDSGFHQWNVALMEPTSGDPSTYGMGTSRPFRLTVRARTKLSRDTDADIKALMSIMDVLMDVPGLEQRPAKWNDAKVERERILSQQNCLRPLLLMYLIDRYSASRSRDRRPLDAVDDVLAMGIVFPGVTDTTRPQNFVRVRLPDLYHDPAEAEAEAEEVIDVAVD